MLRRHFRREKQATKRLAKPAPGVLPLRFVLPQDQELLEACVALVAMECAFQFVHKQAQERIGPYGKEVMAQELALMLEKQEHQGKVGTNDTLLFRTIRIDAFNRAYPLARSLFLEGRMAIDPTWTEQERALFYDLILQRELGAAAS